MGGKNNSNAKSKSIDNLTKVPVKLNIKSLEKELGKEFIKI